MANVTQWLAWP